MKIWKRILVWLLFISVLSSCFEDNDDVPQIATTLDINDYIWKGMNVFYLYKSDVALLADDRFSSDQDYTNFLRDFSTPESFFDNLLSTVDEFSFLVNDYVALEQSFDGVTKNNGMEFGLVRYPNSSSLVFGYIRYILPGTDAEAKGLKRGNIFNTIDGTQITDQNFRNLLAPDSYTIGLATFDGSTVTPTNDLVSLTKSQYTENPVFITKILNIGNTPVGYLMYNAFTADFDTQLNAAFAQFKSSQVTDLILDVRYNGGGSVSSAIDLSSMITGQFNGEVFTTEEWNAALQDRFGSTNLFDNQIRTGDAINSLNLTRVYVLTTRSSASASELVINGLDPYIETIQVGDTTRGKFQASITVYDTDNYGRQGAEASGHTYAMQPLVLKSINAAGVSDYFNGFAPDVLIEEDYSNLGMLGDPEEPLLKAAIDQITGAGATKQKYSTQSLNDIGSSKMYLPNFEKMYVDFTARNNE
ncbi:peptidase S41 [Aquimarina sp. U1-2]|uniref:S41 family peptidase n=1 Tax=Aquimarina sp. U1-2 TaxID=2823141 RepID=UPI001AECBC0B|nr:S41 family peptidase [Aquimarina sp. U1-2]MBP2832963.1 peptidase S41 [Aquimarina sp. U1-2]